VPLPGYLRRQKRHFCKKWGQETAKSYTPSKKLIDEFPRNHQTYRRIKGLLAEDLSPKTQSRHLEVRFNPFVIFLTKEHRINSGGLASSRQGYSREWSVAKAVKIQVEEALKPLVSEMDS